MDFFNLIGSIVLSAGLSVFPAFVGSALNPYPGILGETILFKRQPEFDLQMTIKSLGCPK